LLLFNFRLGKWVSCRKAKAKGIFKNGLDRLVNRPAPLLLAYDYLFRDPKHRRYVFVSDGGHHENLGIEALLKRKCRVVIVSDVGADPKYAFKCLLRVIRRARIYYGISFSGIEEWNDDRPREADSLQRALDEVRPDGDTGFSREHFFVSRIDYRPEATPSRSDRTCYLIYLKSSMTGDEPPELLSYRKERGKELFPHEPRLDQLFDERQFDVYRQLGEHIGQQLCQCLFHDDMGEEPFLANHWTPPPECDNLFGECTHGQSSAETFPTRGNGRKMTSRTLQAR
jgi:hypothetical protein